MLVDNPDSNQPSPKSKKPKSMTDCQFKLFEGRLAELQASLFRNESSSNMSNHMKFEFGSDNNIQITINDIGMLNLTLEHNRLSNHIYKKILL